MARRRMANAHPAWMPRAMAARKSVLHVIAKTIEKDDDTGADTTVITTGSSFVIKVDLQARQSILLASEHVVRGRLRPGDGLRVRIMHPMGVQEFPASIIHMNKAMDVALLRVPGLTAAAPLRFAPEPIVGESIAAVGYCDPDGLFAVSSYSRIPAINAGSIRGTVMYHYYKGIRLYHVLFSCPGMEGMSGGPLISKRGVEAMIDSGVRGCTYGVHPRTILAVMKSCIGIQQQENLTMEDVIARIA